MFLPFIMIRQIRADRKRSGRERGGVGSGKVLESGFELGTPVAQKPFMSARCPQDYQRRLVYLFKYVFGVTLNFHEKKKEKSFFWKWNDPKLKCVTLFLQPSVISSNIFCCVKHITNAFFGGDLADKDMFTSTIWYLFIIKCKKWDTYWAEEPGKMEANKEWSIQPRCPGS